MKETPREEFEELLLRIEEHLRATGQEERLRGLDTFRTAARHGDERLAAHAMDKLLVFTQGEGQDVELLPYVEAARSWCAAVGVRSFHS